MNDERGEDSEAAGEEWVTRLRDEYHAAPPTPREDMWAAIAPQLGPRAAPTLSLDEARARRALPPRRVLGWVAAAAALFVVGIGIGRSTATGPSSSNPSGVANAPVDGGEPAGPSAPLRFAALRHLERTEGLLTMVRADGRAGRIDPTVGPWASTLLAQTRLMLDYTAASDPAMRTLLEDLELVLVQIVGASELSSDDERTAAEVTITLDAIERREVVPRIQALMPTGSRLAGV
jgi:hypothetical protein